MDQELQKERYELVTGRIREIAKEESVPARYPVSYTHLTLPTNSLV